MSPYTWLSDKNSIVKNLFDQMRLKDNRALQRIVDDLRTMPEALAKYSIE